MRLADRGGAVTIITTNFDLLLEEAAGALKPPIQTYALGGIPRPTTSPDFNGVLHIHGVLELDPNRTSDLILSDQDFGEFYLRRRIVSDLIYDASRLYHLVFVGYSANDPPMRYLLNAVAADRIRYPDIKEQFILVGMRTEDSAELADWRARGIIPIPYDVRNHDHSQLDTTLEKWADYSATKGSRSQVERELERIVQRKRAEAGDDDRDLFDHLIRRSSPRERIRLSELASGNGGDLAWLDAIVKVSSEESRRITDGTEPA